MKESRIIPASQGFELRFEEGKIIKVHMYIPNTLPKGSYIKNTSIGIDGQVILLIETPPEGKIIRIDWGVLRELPKDSSIKDSSIDVDGIITVLFETPPWVAPYPKPPKYQGDIYRFDDGRTFPVIENDD